MVEADHVVWRRTAESQQPGRRPLAPKACADARRPLIAPMESKNPRIDEEAVRRTAYFLWKEDGKPAGRELEYWERALQQHIRQLAYDRWLAEGSPDGQAQMHWQQAEEQVRGRH
jgi:hypothetical protein